MSAGIKTGNIATDWLIDRISNSSKKNAETGKMEAGFLEGLAGSAFGLDTDLIATTKEQNINNQAANNLLEANGLTRAELGIGEDAKITTGLVGSKTRKYNEQKQDERDTKAFERSIALPTKQLEAQVEESRLTRESQADQFRTQLQAQESRYAFDGEQRALDRSLERQLSNNSSDMQMQIAQMNADLADKRMAYDRETKRMDRRDRAIAQLMSGLGQLGGAFSL